MQCKCGKLFFFIKGDTQKAYLAHSALGSSSTSEVVCVEPHNLTIVQPAVDQ